MPEPKIPAWLAAAVDQRIALMRDKIGPGFAELADNTNLVMTPLTEPAEGATDAEREKWERTCDRCGVYCNSFARFYTGAVQRELDGVQVTLMFGVCHRCKEAS